jgi:hypothetical protein
MTAFVGQQPLAGTTECSPGRVRRRTAPFSCSKPSPERYSSPGRGREAEIPRIVEFWLGDVPLGRAFWLWGIVGGGVVSLFVTLFALMLLAAGAPAWLAVLVFAAHIPWNLILLVGVWRSAGRPEVSRAHSNLVRLVILLWVVVLSLV